MADTLLDRDTSIYKQIETIDRNRKALRIWLLIVLVTLFALVLVGGATRLTDSGLSITQWKPIHGVIPPLNAAEWDEEFALYKQIPEYSQVNSDMTVDEFKTIFWWEWGHRVLARSIGLVFGLPLLGFWLAGRIEPRLRLPLFGLLLLGGFQGFIGWWMVSSGLSERVDVSQYRLATHLTIASLIFAGITWIWRALSPHSGDTARGSLGHRMAIIFAVLVIVQIYLGALVAGLDAGMAYNTWPLMDGAIIPGDLFVQDPAWRNLFENGKTVQFVHRMNAYLLLAFAILNVIMLQRSLPGTTHARRGIVLLVLVVLQSILGIVTLLRAVPIHEALAHQGMALIVLGFAIAHWRGFLGAYPRSTDVTVRS